MLLFFMIVPVIIVVEAIFRGLSSAGRALAWHARGRRFNPDSLHNNYR